MHTYAYNTDPVKGYGESSNAEIFEGGSYKRGIMERVYPEKVSLFVYRI